MQPKELPEDVTSPTRIEPAKPLGAEPKLREPEEFASLMKEPLKGQPTQKMMSPMELAAGQHLTTTGPNTQTLLAQIQGTQNTINDLRNQMKTPNLTLKQSQKYLLQNKLTEANTNLRSANIRLGVENPPEPTKPSGPSPIDKFIAYITDGQLQLESAHQQIAALNKSGRELTPGDFLQIQVKLNKAQQQLEYSSVLLSKAVEAMKMLFQINL